MKAYVIRRKNTSSAWIYYGNDGWKPAIGIAIQYVREGDAKWISGLMDFETFVVPIYIDDDGIVSLFPEKFKFLVPTITAEEKVMFCMPAWQKNLVITKDMIDELRKETDERLKALEDEQPVDYSCRIEAIEKQLLRMEGEEGIEDPWKGIEDNRKELSALRKKLNSLINKLSLIR